MVFPLCLDSAMALTIHYCWHLLHFDPAIALIWLPMLSGCSQGFQPASRVTVAPGFQAPGNCVPQPPGKLFPLASGATAPWPPVSCRGLSLWGRAVAPSLWVRALWPLATGMAEN